MKIAIDEGSLCFVPKGSAEADFLEKLFKEIASSEVVATEDVSMGKIDELKGHYDYMIGRYIKTGVLWVRTSRIQTIDVGIVAPVRKLMAIDMCASLAFKP